VISIVNTGTTAYNGITLTDNLGEYAVGDNSVYPLNYVDGSARYYVNGVLQPAPTVTPGPPMAINGINVPAGGNATIVYEGVLTAFAPLEAGSTITNTVTATGAGISEPITSAATVTVATAPDLSINKSISPNPVTENGQVTFTFVIQNTGNAPANTGLAVTDQFNPVLTNVSAAIDGTALAPATQFTYNPANGRFSTVGDVLNVPAATYEQNPATGAITTTPGVTTLTVTGTI
ncbi:MAG: hypothetical protein KBS41_04100, partial [Oscillospiraceae bacterium]|nr:hypothetical protein [Candidatus Equicaccousia limihippi]